MNIKKKKSCKKEKMLVNSIFSLHQVFKCFFFFFFNLSLLPQCILFIPKQISFFRHLCFVVYKCFQLVTVLKFVIWLRVNPLLHKYSFRRINNRQLLKTLWEKEEIACNKQLILFPQCFLLNQIIVSHLSIFLHHISI